MTVARADGLLLNPPPPPFPLHPPQAEIYYAYDLIHNAVSTPFKTTHASTLFNVSRFLLMRTLNREPPPGISIANVVYILAKYSMELRAFMLARFASNTLLVCGGGWGGEGGMHVVCLGHQLSVFLPCLPSSCRSALPPSPPPPLPSLPDTAPAVPVAERGGHAVRGGAQQAVQ